MGTYVRKASASQIQKWLKCPRSWYYRYVERVPEPPSIYLIRGVLLHDVIEQLHRAGIRDLNATKHNYEDPIREFARELFDKRLHVSRDYFGKPRPSSHEELVSLYQGDMTKVNTAVEDAWKMFETYIDKCLIDLRQFMDKHDNLSKSWNNFTPYQNEFKINLDNFQGFIDQVFKTGSEIVISDLKTSTLHPGQKVDSDFYRPAGLSCLNPEYTLQLLLYFWGYYKMTGVQADWLGLTFLKHSHELVIPTQFMDKDKVLDEMEYLVNTFMLETESNNIEDYPMNINDTVQIYDKYKLENIFCTCKLAKFADRDYCPYSDLCDKYIDDSGFTMDSPEDSSDSTVILTFKEDGSTAQLAGWLAKKKGMNGSEITVETIRETAKAILVKFDEKEEWIPKSMLK